MKLTGDSFSPEDFLRTTRGELALWATASLIVLSGIGSGVWAYQRFVPAEPAGEPAGAMTVEFAEFVTSPAEEELEIAEGAPTTASEAAPETEAEPDPEAEPVDEPESIEEVKPLDEPEPVVEEAPPFAEEVQPVLEEPPPAEVSEPEPVARMAAVEPESIPEPEPAPVETAEPVIEVPEAEVPEPAVVIERQAEVVPEVDPVEEPPVVEPVEPEPEPEPLDPNMPMPVAMPQRIADIRAETPATKFTPPPQRKTAPPPSAASVAAAPKPAAEKAEQVAAPQQAVSAEPSASQIQSWQNSVLRHLARRKRNPNEGRRGQGGVVMLRFNIDASGQVQSVSIAQSSGFPALDKAATDLAWASSPLPPPPAGQEKFPIVIPLEYDGNR
ncbi:TonB family protein [Devosia sp. BK]|uniref:energy transducer TonB family protein n=1 Tax=Devosia sp. BK TaxID=2871706 RepID=UPI00293A30E5|nr:TonB family protein [Devosia sp. BK]MDV3249942.1 TonB family protein [Devosia sp. BK]